jgi:SH3 domain-containing YSC84-like protein 1
MMWLIWGLIDGFCNVDVMIDARYRQIYLCMMIIHTLSSTCPPYCSTLQSIYSHLLTNNALFYTSLVIGVRIPARLLELAKGIAVLTVVKGGFGLAGCEFGTGLVVARIESNNETRWSPPSAIGTAGLSWGALVGAQVSDHVFLLMTQAAVQVFFQQGSVQLGVDLGVALGPLGRAVEANFGASPQAMAPVYTYSLSKGLYAGLSLDGKVVVTRDRVNERFYGRPVSGLEILQGGLATPPAAQPLYEALTRCHVYATSERPRMSTSLIMPPSDRIMGEYGELLREASG